MKPGFKTSELWVTVVFLVATLGAAATEHIRDPTVAAIVGAIVVAAYSIARALAKKQGASLPPIPMMPGSGGDAPDTGERRASLSLSNPNETRRTSAALGEHRHNGD